MRVWAARAMMAITAATRAAAMIFVTNLCDHQVDLYDIHVAVLLAPSGTFNRDFPVGFKGIFCLGADPHATLAEFTIDDTAPKAWYDISIIPTNTNGKGPGYYPSLDECKRHTGGGWGFNIQMQIHPRTNQNGDYGKTVTCMHVGCDDAYQFPKDDNKTNNCPSSSTEFDVVFCPVGNGGQTPTTLPMVEARSIDELFNSGGVDGSGSTGIGTEEEAIIEPIAVETAVPIGMEDAWLMGMLRYLISFRGDGVDVCTCVGGVET